MSPALSRELCTLAAIPLQQPESTCASDWQALFHQWQSWLTRLQEGMFGLGAAFASPLFSYQEVHRTSTLLFCDLNRDKMLNIVKVQTFCMAKEMVSTSRSSFQPGRRCTGVNRSSTAKCTTLPWCCRQLCCWNGYRNRAVLRAGQPASCALCSCCHASLPHMD